MFKKANFKPTKHGQLCSLRENVFRLRTGPNNMAALGYLGAKTSLKEDVVPTLLQVLEAMLMPSICTTQAATRASSTTVHLGSKRAVSADTVGVDAR